MRFLSGKVKGKNTQKRVIYTETGTWIMEDVKLLLTNGLLSFLVR